MLRKRGFTLVELLVVIAIITILASIVVPRVQNWIGRARMTKAVTEIRNADLALTKMLADADKKSFVQFFNHPSQFAKPFGSAVALYSAIFYELLRRGKEANFDGIPGIDPTLDPPFGLRDEVKRKLGTSYMDIGMDPWRGLPYQFYIGPLSVGQSGYEGNRVRFRAHRGTLPEDPPETPYVYNARARNYENSKMRGNPPADDLYGYPAPKDLPVYIFSPGGDEQINQFGDTPEQGGGDDINNWDNAGAWDEYY